MKNLDPHNDSHWTSHVELTKKGAPKPPTSSPLWNAWAANNATPQSIAMKGLKVSESIMRTITGHIRGAKPVDHS